MKSKPIILFILLFAFSNFTSGQSYWSLLNIPELDTSMKIEYRLNKVKKITSTTKLFKDKFRKAPEAYKTILTIDTLGNILTKTIKMLSSDSTIEDRKNIFDKNSNIIRVIRNNYIYAEFDYDYSNRVVKSAYFKFDGSLMYENYYDYIYAFNEKLKDCLSRYGDGRIDTVCAHNYTYIFKNKNPIQFIIYYKDFLPDTSEYDYKGRLISERKYRGECELYESSKITYNDDNNTEIREWCNEDSCKKYVYKFDDNKNLINTYLITSKDSTIRILSQEFDIYNNLIVSRNYKEDGGPYFLYYTYNAEKKVINFIRIQNGTILFQRDSDYYPNGLIKCVKEYEGSRIMKEEDYTYEYY